MNGNAWIIRPCGLLQRDGAMLWMRYHYNGQERYNLPGGNLEAGEEMGRGLAREFDEEMGLKVTVGALLGSIQTQAAGRDVLHLLFAVTANGEPRLNPAETKALELVWLNLEEATAYPLYPIIPAATLARLFQGQGIEGGHLGLLQQPWF
ncbi:NUDIX hydrolase [Magnetococcus marinus MC-1]|uniref:NUDIX hydrolase n=1 Tax=Magnetococcus marinus (strain ATCC BAA-1437 / JCM 17883 / MC-1) TaxID=156889 RepID=A0LC06_MAGMM|nr:NUDIX hydrolase [Magnetococcus marinus]ABK45499.1 NUDIX hydrolase [Magnetococcus marinus MC-1]